ncbi:hypothetical protein ACWFNS_14065 [Oerskovia enterophila]
MDLPGELSLVPGVESVWVHDGEEELVVSFDDDASGDLSMDVWQLAEGWGMVRVLLTDVSVRVSKDELSSIVQAVAARRFATDRGRLSICSPDGTERWFW